MVNRAHSEFVSKGQAEGGVDLSCPLDKIMGILTVLFMNIILIIVVGSRSTAEG